MSPKLPVISGEQLIRALEKTGYVAVRQKGSHVRMRHLANPQKKPLSIPLHKTLKRGFLMQVLRDTQLSREDLIALL